VLKREARHKLAFSQAAEGGDSALISRRLNMDRLILGFVWFFGAALFLSAAVQTARAAIGGDIVWTVVWIAVLILILVVMGWVLRSIKEKIKLLKANKGNR
jgi:uncharacterized membrane protein